MKHTFYKNILIDKRRKIKKIIQEATQNRKHQKLKIIKGIINPIQDCIDNEKKVISGEISLEHYLLMNKKLSIRLQTFFGGEKI